MRHLSIEITDTQYKDLKRLLSHGQKQQLFNQVINDLVSIYNEEGKGVFDKIIRGVVHITTRSLLCPDCNQDSLRCSLCGK